MMSKKLEHIYHNILCVVSHYIISIFVLFLQEIKPEIKSEPQSMDMSENNDSVKKEGFKSDSVKVSLQYRPTAGSSESETSQSQVGWDKVSLIALTQ